MTLKQFSPFAPFLGLALAAILYWRAGWPSHFSDAIGLCYVCAIGVPIIARIAFDREACPDGYYRALGIATTAFMAALYLSALAFPDVIAAH